MSDSPSLTEFPFLRSIAAIGACAVVALVGTGAVLTALGQSGHWPVAALTCLACVIGSVAGLGPVALKAGDPDGVGMGAMYGGAFRVLVTLGLVSLIRAASEFDTAALAGWTVGWYLLLLAVEVAWLGRFLARREAVRSQAPATVAEGGRA